MKLYFPRVCRWLALLSMTGMALAAQAQTYPAKPIKLIVPFAPGGITDLLARTVAQKMGESLGQVMVVENRAGAGGTVGTEAVAKASADGYTLLMGATSTLAINPGLYPKLGYDATRDFVPIGLVAMNPSVLTVSPGVPASNLRELIALAKSQPGKLSYGSAGSGSSQHLAGDLFKADAGIDMLHVPYKGGGPAMTDLLGGQITMIFEPLPTAIAHIRGGKLKALGVTTRERVAALPDVPTIAEAGLPGYEVVVWFGLFAPTGTPPAITAKLNVELNRALNLPEVKQTLTGQGADPAPVSQEKLAALLAVDQQKWGKLIRARGIKVE